MASSFFKILFPSPASRPPTESSSVARQRDLNSDVREDIGTCAATDVLVIMGGMNNGVLRGDWGQLQWFKATEPGHEHTPSN